jgi:hypothetical protein
MRLPHGFVRSGGVLDPDRPASLGGGAGAGGAAREGVSEAGGMVVLAASGPWGRPRGPMIIFIIRQVSEA